MIRVSSRKLSLKEHGEGLELVSLEAGRLLGRLEQ